MITNAKEALVNVETLSKDSFLHANLTLLATPLPIPPIVAVRLERLPNLLLFLEKRYKLRNFIT